MEIVRQCTLPPSSVYRRISEFLTCGLLVVDRIIVTEEGKKYSLYRSAVKEMRADFKAGEIELNISFNTDVVDKLSRIWTTMRLER